MLRAIKDNLAFVIFGGFAGYMLGYILLPVVHGIAGAVANAGYSPVLRLGVQYSALALGALGGASIGLKFASIVNGPRDVDDPETDLDAILDEERQSWSDFRD